MNLIFYYILQLTEYLLIISCGIVLVSFVFHYLSNEFNVKFINVYGFFTSMDDFSLIMLSSAILKEITLVYCIFKLSDTNNLYLYIFLVLCFTYAFLTFKVSKFTKELMLGTLEYLILYFLNLLTSFLIEVRQSKMVEYYIFILSVTLIACSVYFFIKDLAYIVARNKNVRRNLIAR